MASAGCFTLNQGERFDLSIFEDGRIDEYKCVKCKEINMEIYQTPCGHRLCQNCYSDILNKIEKGQTVSCPANEDFCEDMSPNLKPQRDFAAKKDLHKMIVKSPNHEFGCKEKMILKELSNLLTDTCKFKVVHCKYAKKGCTFRSLSSKIDDHVKTCQYRPQKCQHCKSVTTVIEMQNHLQKCAEAPVECPYSCELQTTIKRKSLPEHLSKCPLAPKPCQFEEFKCSAKGNSEQLKQHMVDAQGHHLMLMCDYVRDLEEQQKDLRNNRGPDDKSISSIQKQIRDLGKKFIEFKSEVTKSIESAKIQDHSKLNGNAKDSLTRQDTSSATISSTVGNDDLRKMEADLNLRLEMIKTKVDTLQLQVESIDVTTYEGGIIWRIDNYSQKKRDAISNKTVSIYSPPFYTSRYGYKLCARVYLNGDGDGKGSYISAYFVLLRGKYDNLNKWPFDHKVSIRLLDQEGTRDVHYTFTPKPANQSQKLSFIKPESEMNVASGLQKFVAHSTAEKAKYLIDDTMYLKIEVDKTHLFDPFERRFAHEP